MKKIPNVIFVWTDGMHNERDFENTLALLTLLKRNKDLGYHNDFIILLDDGERKLGQEYIKSLTENGATLIQVHALYQQVLSKFPSLEAYGSYECHCFLRWIVIQRALKTAKYVHYDADVIYNEDPRIISQKISAVSSFVLQGCPAFASITPKWLKVYSRELTLFVKNPQEYSENANQLRDKTGRSKKSKWSGSWNRPMICSDQDLISYLIHRNQLPQVSPHDLQVVFSDYLLFENPLYIDECLDAAIFPLTYTQVKGVDYLGKKKVLLWHMQSYFVRFLSRYLLKKKMQWIGIQNVNPFEVNRAIDRVIDRISAWVGYDHRKKVYEKIFAADLLNHVLKNEAWWKKRIFT